jgi:hypothetical protein
MRDRAANTEAGGRRPKASTAILTAAIQQLRKIVADFADHFTTRELTFTRATGDDLTVSTLEATTTTSRASNTQQLCLTDAPNDPNPCALPNPNSPPCWANPPPQSLQIRRLTRTPQPP